MTLQPHLWFGLFFLLNFAHAQHNFAYFSLATNEDYALSALALGQSLVDTNTPFPLILITVQDRLSPKTVQLLSTIWKVVTLPIKAFKCPSGPLNDKIGHFQETCHKLLLWSFDEIDKGIFLDADSLVLQNIDHLFQIPDELAAVPQPGQPELFQTAMFVFTPAKPKTEQLMKVAYSAKIDGGDLPILNAVFGEKWGKSEEAKLPYTYMITRLEGRTFPTKVNSRDGTIIDWDAIVIFDFAGPSEYKPWVLTKMKGWEENLGANKNGLNYAIKLWDNFIQKAKKNAPKNEPKNEPKPKTKNSEKKKDL